MKFYVTFGQRFAYEPHKVLKNAHPNGYVIINAPSMAEARAKTFEWLGSEWAFIYTEKEFLESEYLTMYVMGLLEER